MTLATNIPSYHRYCTISSSSSSSSSFNHNVDQQRASGANASQTLHDNHKPSSSTRPMPSTNQLAQQHPHSEYLHQAKALTGMNMIKGNNYDEAYNNFKWTIPEHFNIGMDVCDKHLIDRPNQPAIVHEDESGNVEKITFAQLYQQSNQLANAMEQHGIAKGDRVGVLLSQGIETALSHVTVFRMGSISIPLFTQFGPEGLVFRLKNSEASCVLTDYDNLPKILMLKKNLSKCLKRVFIFGHNNKGVEVPQDDPMFVEWSKVRDTFGTEYTPVKTKADDPALIIFTSGTTGLPKGCLHGHRVLLGHLPGVQFPQNMFPQTDKELCFYTPADWAWIGGLIDVLLPSLYYGVTVLAHRATKFDAHKMLSLMDRHRVTTCFLPPTALKMMRQTELAPYKHMVSIGSGGESLGDQLLEWGRKVFNVTINEFYGQTEANLLVGNCSAIMPTKNGSMGRIMPGHTVAVLDGEGNPLPANTVGNISLKSPDPVMFLRYWNNDEATKSKFVGPWLMTGDLGRMDRDGYLWYVGRDDDIINSSGYRIGPTEIENCILKHSAVAMCGVIGAPDELRGEVVKAYIVLKDGVTGSDSLKSEIQELVKKNLAAYEYPRLVEFIQSLPMTNTGKIMRKELRHHHEQSVKASSIKK
ncbi:hypothetical protein SAMD00019534_030510 [Acytostelium subglobosum LB1]|uniref:hypothetical protein n=1 Tax=Acytostelium subglobosum LB1 TaxID=1410327 RepID=UPI000644C211|nr:hypothetical protein SAMD00019534_030510 [Acytostelium subglobosum LB1]GAM19876.1 hypothetical protein SAMD00019534_030510 [Acytostelium subglobosum LB1]|eukprot:XP_012756638.1 hypothetical protein SAMD00019534_030510 [Acytostelium subglobosum LB1]